VKPQGATTVAKAGEKEGDKEKDKDKDKDKTAKAETPPQPASASKGGETQPKSNGALAEPFGEGPIEDDPQLQKAVELLKTWKIFKELRPL